MEATLKSDLENIESILDIAKNYSINYLHQLNDRKTSIKTHNSEEFLFPESSIGAICALEIFKNQFENFIIGSSGPRYWGFVTGGSTPASIVGDWLTSVFDQNPQAINGYGDVSANIEVQTISLLLKLLNLPEDYTGGFVSGATMSNFTCLATARQWFGNKTNSNIALNGINGKINVFTATPHSSILKSLSMLGIGSQNLIKIKCIENREAIDIGDLEKKIRLLNNEPFILTTSAGTVNSADFDDFKAISQLRQKYNFWWHIDAAFGAFAALSSNHKQLLDGWENADSITVDCHKWLNVPYENAVFLIKKKHKSLQIETFQNSNAPYLGDINNDFNYLNLLPENSRRLKALPVWFSLIAYGRKGHTSIIENSIKLAAMFESYIENNPHLTLLCPVRLNNVCFSLNKNISDLGIKDFLRRVNERGNIFMTPTVYNSKDGIRASFVNWRTTENDIKIAIEELELIISEIIKT